MNGPIIMKTLSRFSGILVITLLVTSCATNPYTDAKRRTAAGGENSVRLTEAQVRTDKANIDKTLLEDKVLQSDRDIERNARRIASAEADLINNDKQLASALQSRKISQARHDQLKREVDGLRAEVQRADLDNQARGMSRNPNPAADAAKEARLKDLEKRKKELEDTLAKLAEIK